jgi:hypothetical protein
MGHYGPDVSTGASELFAVDNLAGREATGLAGVFVAAI